MLSWRLERFLFFFSGLTWRTSLRSSLDYLILLLWRKFTLFCFLLYRGLRLSALFLTRHMSERCERGELASEVPSSWGSSIWSWNGGPVPFLSIFMMALPLFSSPVHSSWCWVCSCIFSSATTAIYTYYKLISSTYYISTGIGCLPAYSSTWAIEMIGWESRTCYSL